MYSFPENARVAFIGDSLTAGGFWTHCVADYYHQHCPEQNVQCFPCAVSGGTALTAMLYLRENVLRFAPTHAVIMLGTNDLGSYLYESESFTPGQKAEQEMKLHLFRDSLRSLAQTLQEIGRVQHLAFMTPIPFDYSAPMPEGTRRGIKIIDDATVRAGAIVKDIAAQFDAPVIDTYAALRPIMDEIVASHSGLAFTADRVHPTKEGYHALARVFLRAQGFDVAAPTAQSIADGSVLFTLSPKGERFAKAALAWQDLLTALWLIGQYAPDQRTETLVNFASPYPKEALPAWYGDAPGFREKARILSDQLPHMDQLAEELRSAAAFL